MRRHMAEDQVGRDRRHLIEPRLAELALDIEFLGKAEAAMGLDAHVGGKPGGFRGQQLGHVGFAAAGLAGIEHRRRLGHHLGGGGDLHIGARNRELDALVLADGPAEDAALPGIGGGAVDEEAAIADAFGGDQDALGIHAVDDVAEALVLLADQIFGRHFEIVEEQLGGGVVEHGADGPDGEALAQRLLHIDQQHAHAVGRLGDLLARRGAHQQHHEIGMLGAG